jgi:4-hydroxybenzoyl-CoA thioesterase
MVVVERTVRFQDVDPAGIVFFAHFATYAHEAMEAFFDQVEGGYADLIMRRRVGFPAVKLESEYHAPLRYGDVVRIETTVAKLGNRSAVFRYRFRRHGGDNDGEEIADLSHTVVITNLDAMASREMPTDVRAALAAHLQPA